MLTVYASPAQLILCLWFGLSIFSHFIGRQLLKRWLRQRGKNLNLFLIDIPGHLEITYINWCRDQKIPIRKDWLAFQCVSFLSSVISSIVFVLVVPSWGH